jgi:hypothetical protein
VSISLSSAVAFLRGRRKQEKFVQCCGKSCCNRGVEAAVARFDGVEQMTAAPGEFRIR